MGHTVSNRGYPPEYCRLFDKKRFAKLCPWFRDRSFFMREGGLVGFGGGALEKNWLERGASRKKMKDGGGGRTKKLD